MSVALHSAPAWTREESAAPEAVSARLRARGVALEPGEVTRLESLLGRPPRWAEAVLFGILWSEHCSYKSTRQLLRRLPVHAPQVVIGPGEDAGVVALPAPCDDLVLVLGHESHNHPSQVLPVEGAATGIGGIVRDVVCMGAEVVGVLDALRFGDPSIGVRVRDVMRGVVQGIAGYANPLGVPNLGGDVVFASGFDASCLVNAMAVGLAPADGVIRSRVPEGPGPWVFVLVGKPTDESGFGGAAFASDALAGGDARGAVQLPDPFLERVLNVATGAAFARVRERGVPCGFKDLGAGGIACATSELAAAGGCGASLILDDAPRVARAIAPEVLLCAETQERYCWVVPERFAPELVAIYEREFALAGVHPGAGARVIGRATPEPRYRVTWQGETLIDCATEAITAGVRAERRSERRARPAPPRARRRRAPDLHRALLQLLGGDHVGSREYLVRHYDTEVQGRTWLRPGEADAAVIRIHPRRPTGLAFAVGGNPFWCEGGPELGARHAVAEAARNVAVVGARPWALTDCLNFGAPEDPLVMGDLEETLAGLAAAAGALGGAASPGHPLPFVSGNVSLYNQGGDRAIPPSPIVMCAGVIADVSAALAHRLQRAGDVIVLVGEPRDGLEGTSFRREILREPGGPPPALSLEHEARLQQFAVAVAEGRWASAAHDVSDGGVAVALAEMALAAPGDAGLGLEADLSTLEVAPAVALFCERPALLYEVGFERLARFSQAAREHGMVAWPIGTVLAQPLLRVRLPGATSASWTLGELREAAARALSRHWNEEDA
ncbi:MAG TPA: phosphoribosylformylglycinamidine synthase subunit PurL [Candidatus Acidoferrales bacterium]|nr:phosphoribosylformylglycinamidine synthase subunit PurL [Candidatus Acidoferrales bacterium]